MVFSEMKNLVIERRAGARSRREDKGDEGKETRIRTRLRSRLAVEPQIGSGGDKSVNLVIVLKVSGDRLEELWGEEQGKRRSRRRR